MLRDASLALIGIAAGVGLTFLPALFADDDRSTPSPLPTSQAESVAAASPADDPAPALSVPGADSATSAVSRFLGAEQQGDLAASFELLSAEDRRSITSVEDWLEVHADLLPAVVAYEVGEPEVSGTRVVVPAVVEFEPRLDEFAGLVPGRSTVSWLAVEDELGWRVSLADSSIEPIYPPEADATGAAQEWLDSGSACDPEAAVGPGTTFLGLRPYLLEALCRADGAFTVGAAGEVDDPVVTTDLVTAFGSRALDWARVVPVEGSVAVRLVMAPIGDRWAVIDVAEGDR